MFTFQTKLAILKAIVRKKGPYYIQFYINGRCNLKCKQCNIVETNSGLQEMTIDEIRVVARNIRRIGGGIVLLTGGEPFLRKDVHEVAKAFLDENLDVRLQTAGQATTEQLQQCYDVGCRDLNISLDSLDPNKQDYINSVPGTWEKAILAIERVSEIFRGHSAICSLGCVLSRFNYREIPAILEFASSIGWYLSLVPVHISQKTSKYGFRSYDEDFSFNPEDYRDLKLVIEQLISMKRAGHLLFDAESYLWSAYEFLQGKPPTWRNANNGLCDSPDLYFAVRPNGDFTTCCDYIVEDTYNLKDPEFADWYRQGLIHKKAEPIVKACSGCHYGSYPEVSISVRDKRALLERIKIVLFQEKQVINTYPQRGLFDLIENIKEKYPAVYGEENWMRPEVTETLGQWSTPTGRKRLTVLDTEKRRSEGRVRKRSQRHDDDREESRDSHSSTE